MPTPAAVPLIVLIAAAVAFNVLKSDLARAQGKISFTSDLWLDQKLCPFMALTAHQTAKEEQTSVLVLKAALIAFYHIPGSHTGKSLGSIILHLLDRANIAKDVSV
ncbi:uncharacterized protein EDB93DRAFT_1250525 [Suillus bovinus]|uniref:uncharacterized protein n=1 Tax=Suillus bovinus TaxID=48563 RepID=UPI001B860C32|nr:uncharacterized protein EDB93DRAFT_1250525 [Suillus bovinus]KAG2147387.1 hypothetical protein EDB93DRAFT_1250525 [Suillus bovinus]